MTPLASLFSFTGPVASAEATPTGLPAAETGDSAETEDFSSMLAAALAGMNQPSPVVSQPQPGAVQTADAVAGQPIREGVRFTESAPPRAEVPAEAGTAPTAPTDPAGQPTAFVALEVPAEAATLGLSELVEETIRADLFRLPEAVLGATAEPTRVSSAPVPPTTPAVPPSVTPEVVAPPAVPVAPTPVVATPTREVAPERVQVEPPVPVATPTLSQASTAPAATIANGRTLAVPSLVPAQATTIGPVPADPSAAAVTPTGVDVPAEPVEAPPVVAAVPTLTETPTGEVEDRFADVVGEIGERRSPKRPDLDTGLPVAVPFEARLSSAQRTEARPVEVVRPTPTAQVADQIVTRAEVIGRGEQAEFRLRLDPPELGQIEVRVHKTAAGVQADLTVADEAVRQMIESQLPELRQKLEAAGLSVDRFNLTAQDNSTGRERQGRNVPDLDDDRTPARRPVAAAAPRTYTAPVAQGGRLDITA